MELSVKVYLLDNEGQKFMGIGVLWLLERIKSEGSLLKASKSMGLSYSKATQMLFRAEKELKTELIERKKGGTLRLGSTLTPFAEEFILLYKDFSTSIKKEAEEKYNKFLKSLSSLKEK